jgi:hypothetical protein
VSQPAGDDAQRDLEQRALRNVRGLVDRMEGDEARQRWTMRRYVVVLAIVVVAFALASALLIRAAKEPAASKSITLPPAQAPK